MGRPCLICASEDRAALLRFARSVAERELGVPGVRWTGAPLICARCDGVFVTFRSGSRLRGCMGSLFPVTDLCAAVESMTQAALRDPRFVDDDPIRPEELSTLTMEISLITGLRKADDSTMLIPGVHGVMVRKGEASGCFLPKVALEQGWSAEELLAYCCRYKAGLPPDTWREADCEVMLFEADVLAEDEATGTVVRIGQQ